MFSRPTLICLCLLLLGAASSASLAQVPSAAEQQLRGQGLTVDQAIGQAALLGIDLSDPDQAMRRATELGISQTHVQEMLRVYREAQQERATRQERPLRIDRFSQSRDDTEDPEDRFEFERPEERERFIDEATGLEYFGYRSFRGASEAFRPGQIQGQAADESYVVSPGDDLRLSVWGAAEFQYDLEVDAAGRVFIPNVGQVAVAGYELRDLRRRMRGILSQRYAGLGTSPPSVNMDLTVARLRPVRIFVLGEVENPGGYTIGTGSTVFQALYAVGGPALTGSLRDVRVVRNGRVVASVDLYRFLLTGNEPSGIRLQDSDHIFVPPRGKTVSISTGQRTGDRDSDDETREGRSGRESREAREGREARGDREGEERVVRREVVLRPAIFELLPDETLRELIAFAGGLKPDVYVQRFQIERIIPFTQRVEASRAREVIDLSLDEVLRQQRDVLLADGDQVSLFQISELLTNPVHITGAVYHPGRYELSSSLRTVGDLLRAADGLRPEAFTGRAQLLRLRPDRVGHDLLPLSITDVLAGNPEADLALRPEDEVRIFSAEELKEEREVHIGGLVRRAGTYSFAAGMTLEDLILQAGGLTVGAALDGAEISRMLLSENPSRRAQELVVPLSGPAARAYFPYAPGDAIVDLDEARTVALEPGDRIQIRASPAYRSQEVVTIHGEVRFPGEYTLLSDTETLSSLIRRAGGLRQNAHPAGTLMMRHYAERRATRASVAEVEEILEERADVRRVSVDVAAVLGGDRGADVQLLPRDDIFIPARPNAVTVLGNVGAEGVYRYRSGQRVSYYLNLSGGLDDRTNAIYLEQPDGTTQRVMRRFLMTRQGDPVVQDAATIVVTRKQGEPRDPLETGGAVLRDIATLATTAVTLIVLINRL